MPNKPSRQCPGRGPYSHNCSNLAKGNESYCPRCSKYAEAEQRQRNKKYDRERDQSKERHFIHSRQWRKIRDAKLAKDPLCEMCLSNGQETEAILVHHIDGDELNNIDENHMPLCVSCHEVVHKKDRWRKV